MSTRTLLGISACVAVTLTLIGQRPAESTTAAPANVPIGSTVQATFTDLRWQPRRLQELPGDRGVVLFFATIECPLVQRYLPRFQEFAERYGGKGIGFVVANVGTGDGMVDAVGQATLHAPAAVFAKDFDGSLSHACGVDRTATVVLLDQERKLRYRGRIDGQYRYSGASPSPGRKDLELALEQFLTGQPIEVAETPVEGCRITMPKAAPAAGAVPTFCRDIAPLLQEHCQECHRPGGEAPFALLTAAEAQKHAEMIGEVVGQQRMPPWYGSSRHGDFANVRVMPQPARDTIARWVAGGAPAGDPADLPSPRQWPATEWRIGEPDLVLKVPTPIRLPADGYVPYKYFVLPYHFEQDTWVEAIEIKPRDKRALHHCNLARVKWGEQFSQDGFITGQVPGGDAMVLEPGTAVRIPAGSALALQAHYVTTGEPVEDRLWVGLRFPRQPVQREVQVLIVHNNRFEIPPGAGAHPVRASKVLPDDALGIGMFVHMHLRGRDMLVTAQPPEGQGEREHVLLVPNYNFDWQQSYRWPSLSKRFAKGTRITALAHFDNSAFNPFNPDPKVPVRFGLETQDEMMYLFLFWLHEHEQLGLEVDPRNGRARPSDR